MTKPNDEAFPVAFDSGKDIVNYGLTKLEYFAAAAMQGALASTASDNSAWPEAALIARRSVEYAKALIERLNQESK
jgi:hypothetical protein